ncbi:MAG: XRE family transcriptional regulator [Bacilli bacterium]|jgi:transcriptional regulator with XRE-family HTH domain|nr:XRE family transcriptional regulator [Bacilli bacterium]
MDIGAKLKRLRLKNGLTLEELANRTELTKGFLSQLERDKTTTSVQTLLDILEVLGTTPVEFFDTSDEKMKVVFTKEDCFIQKNADYTITWLVSNAQKNMMEPILLELSSKKTSNKIPPFEGEAFGYVLQGEVTLYYNEKEYLLKEKNSFYLEGISEHYLVNKGNIEAKIIWIVSPPIF